MIRLPNPDLKSAAKPPPPLLELRTPSDADNESKSRPPSESKNISTRLYKFDINVLLYITNPHN